MGIYGNIGVFNGLGKPTIKLEFDNNEALLDFQRRMQNAGDAESYNNTTWYDIPSTPETVPAVVDGLGTPGDTYIITDTRKRARKDLQDTALFKKFDIQKFDTPENSPATLAPGDAGGVILVPIFDLNFDTKNFQNRQDEFSETSVNRIVDAVDDGEFNWAVFDPITVWKNPQDGKLYVLSGHSRSEAFKRLAMAGKSAQGKKFDRIPAKVFEGSFEEANYLAFRDKRGQFLQADDKQLALFGGDLGAAGDKYELIDNRKNARKSIDNLHNISTKDIKLKIIEKAEPISKYDNDANWIKIFLWKDEGEENGYYSNIQFFAPETKTKNGKGEIKNGYKGYDTTQRINVDIKQVKDLKEQYSNAWHKKYYSGFVSKEYYKKLKVDAIKKQIQLLEKRNKEYSEYYKEGRQRDKYISDNNKQIRYIKDFYDLGKTANNALYNDNSIIDCRGLKPTYTILSDYTAFFDDAKQNTSFAGFGLDDTLKLIADTCRKHYKECSKIAAHLKGDCKLQSAFNLWHWLRHNIRYEYDREGREEVRAPLRTWADRARGVDCDCLSVFAWCVLKCMGYDPVFELVAFRNKPQFSHIFVNLDGIVVDRVWFIFNSRPPLVTKNKIYKVDLFNSLGKLF